MNSSVADFMNDARTTGATRTFVFAMVALFAAVYMGLWVFEPLFVFALIAVTPCIVWWAAAPRVPLLLMVATFPFTSIELTYGMINAPIADTIATVAIAAWVLRFLYFRFVRGKRIHEYTIPLWIAALGFFTVALLSAAQTPDYLISLKFVLRPMIFFYIAFVLLPANTITTRQLFDRIANVLTGLGALVAMYGLAGFVLMPANSFVERRVVPLSFLGINPLAGNHNLIANVLIISIPIALYVLLRESEKIQSSRRMKVLFMLLLVMVAATVLTFSRTGWLTLMLELLVLLALQYRHHMKAIIRYTTVSFVLALPLIIYMSIFSSQDAVQSSNLNRLILNDIAIEMVSESPVFGTGPGTFMEFVARNQLYIREFGAPLDSHGFVQKVAGETGVLGLLGYVSLLGGSLFILLKRAYVGIGESEEWSLDQYAVVTLVAVASGAAFFQLFQTSYYIGLLWLPIGIALGASRVFVQKGRKV